MKVIQHIECLGEWRNVWQEDHLGSCCNNIEAEVKANTDMKKASGNSLHTIECKTESAIVDTYLDLYNKTQCLTEIMP